MKLSIHEFDLPLRHTFTISRESVSVQKTFIVELEDAGHSGFGEATTNSYYGATTDSMRRSVESVRALLESTSLGINFVGINDARDTLGTGTREVA